jgi:ACS family tartrate transporter-like MFS transporter
MVGVAPSSVAVNSIGTRTIRKIQIRILPYILLLYIISFLDRINIGFAALTMNQELGITSQQFGMLVGMFFISYSLFEIPSNLLLYKVGARIWIARILVMWGVTAALSGVVHTIHQLYIARFFLGLAEAGYYPGILLYLTYWFRRREQAQAIALFLIGDGFKEIRFPVVQLTRREETVEHRLHLDVGNHPKKIGYRGGKRPQWF